MSNFYRIITLLLIISAAACASNQPNMTTANDEDKDIGLGGTGMLANNGNSGNDSGLGGTGILGVITGYGSIFVNGIEIEYDNHTAFTINGETAAPQQLEIGDVVEVLTTDVKQHTQAQVINLRHEIIGTVESVEPHTYSFTISGQSIIQPMNKSIFPEVGTTVAVSGFRIDDKTILSSRITRAKTGKTLLRTHTGLPFDKKAQRWLIQTYAQGDTATILNNGIAYSFTLMKKTNKSFKEQLGIKILLLQKSATDKLKFEHVIEQAGMPRGRRTSDPVQHQNGSMLQRVSPGSVMNPNPGSGAAPKTKQTYGHGLPKGKQNGR